MWIFIADIYACVCAFLTDTSAIRILYGRSQLETMRAWTAATECNKAVFMILGRDLNGIIPRSCRFVLLQGH